ncbi:MAG: hypothetical protein IPO87_15715 [Flavobacteriales bacterium]|nr:hypothetical protein [Flavobacteriales bacterium]
MAKALFTADGVRVGDDGRRVARNASMVLALCDNVNRVRARYRPHWAMAGHRTKIVGWGAAYGVRAGSPKARNGKAIEAFDAPPNEYSGTDQSGNT